MASKPPVHFFDIDSILPRTIYPSVMGKVFPPDQLVNVNCRRSETMVREHDQDPNGLELQTHRVYAILHLLS